MSRYSSRRRYGARRSRSSPLLSSPLSSSFSSIIGVGFSIWSKRHIPRLQRSYPRFYIRSSVLPSATRFSTLQSIGLLTILKTVHLEGASFLRVDRVGRLRSSGASPPFPNLSTSYSTQVKMLIKGEKYACEACVRGHRVSNCQHSDRPLQHINKKVCYTFLLLGAMLTFFAQGRPVSQCTHCRTLRKSRSAHVRCDCGGEKAHAKGACPQDGDTQGELFTGYMRHHSSSF